MNDNYKITWILSKFKKLIFYWKNVLNALNFHKTRILLSSGDLAASAYYASADWVCENGTYGRRVLCKRTVVMHRASIIAHVWKVRACDLCRETWHFGL